MLKTQPPRDWDGFFTWLCDHYWASVPPEYQTDQWPSAAPGDPDVPSDIWRASLMVFSDPEAWLNNAIPNQRNRTPLQLIARGQAQRLREILMEVAPFFLAPLEEVRTFGEVADDVSDEDHAAAAAAAEEDKQA